MILTKLERQVQSEIIKYVIKRGGDALKIIAPSRRGCPDILAIFEGRIFLVESKRYKKELSYLQEYFFLIWNIKKQNCFMADSLEMFIEKARKIGIKI